MKETNNSCADVSDNKKRGSLPTKSDSPMEIYGGRGIPKGKQVSTNLEADYDEMDNIIPTKRDTGLSRNGDTIHILLHIFLTENPILSINLTVKRRKRLMRWMMSMHT